MSNLRRVLAGIALVGITVVLIAIQTGSKEKTSEYSLRPNEMGLFQERINPLTKSVTTAEVSFPRSSNPTYLMEISAGENKLQVFVIDSKLFIYPNSSGYMTKIKVTSPVILPIDSSNLDNYFEMGCDSSKNKVVFSTDKVSHSWNPPNHFDCSEKVLIRSGNTPELNLNIKHSNEFKIEFFVMALCGFIAAYIMRRLRSRSVSKQREKFNVYPALFQHKKQILMASLVASVMGLLVFLPSATPTGNLISTSISLANITNSDLDYYDDNYNGGWIFPSSPDLGYRPDVYSTTFDFAFDIVVDSQKPFTELFTYGIPDKVNLKPTSSASFEVSLNRNQQIVFKVPGKNEQNNKWKSQRLAKGVHHIEGQILNGQEVKLVVDKKLTYAMATNVPFYLQNEPNLFVGDYLLENLVNGSLSWSIKTSDETQFSYAMNRILTFLTFALLILVMFLFFSRSLTRGSNHELRKESSRVPLRYMVVAFVSINLLGILIWKIGLQPVQSTWMRNTPMFFPEFRFSDLTQLFVSAQIPDPYSVAKLSYPPFGMFLLDILGFASTRKVTLCIIALSLALIAAVFWRAVSLRNEFDLFDRMAILLSAMLSFPVWFAIDRGNIDFLVISLLLLAAFLQRSTCNNKVVGLIIGLAASIKIYPLLMLPAFLHRRKDWSIVSFALITTLILTKIGAIRYDLNRRELFDNVVLGSSGQGLAGDNATRWNASLAGFITTLTRSIFPEQEENVWNALTSPLVIVLLLFIGFIGLAILLFRDMGRSAVVLFWCASVLLIFPSTPAYRVTLILLGVLAITLYGLPDISRPNLLGAMLGVIMSPAVFWYFGNSATNTYSIFIPIATMTLIALLFLESKTVNTDDLALNLQNKSESSSEVEPISR